MNISGSIKNWTEDERPRERMLQKGAGALSDAELLCILISSGTRERSALDLGRDVLGLAGNNLRELGRLDVKELQKVKGIGAARAITIAAALEIGRRRQISDGPDRVIIQRARDIVDLAIPLLQDLNREVFYVFYLNNSNRLIRYEMLSSGGMAGTVVDIRLVLKSCLMHNASAMIVAHNHPSGSKRPSKQDIDITQKLKRAAAIMDIRLLDHLIVAGNDYVSLADEGLM